MYEPYNIRECTLTPLEGIRTRSIVSRATPRCMAPSPLLLSTETAPYSPMPLAMTGAKATSRIPRGTPSRSCCTPSKMTKQSLNQQSRSGKSATRRHRRWGVFFSSFVGNTNVKGRFGHLCSSIFGNCTRNKAWAGWDLVGWLGNEICASGFFFSCIFVA